jgi:hypothetical protein
MNTLCVENAKVSTLKGGDTVTAVLERLMFHINNAYILQASLKETLL